MAERPKPARYTETWYCEVCDQRFVLILEAEQLIQCATPHHCHTGCYFLDQHGRQIAVVATDQCLPFNTTE